MSSGAGVEFIRRELGRSGSVAMGPDETPVRRPRKFKSADHYRIINNFARRVAAQCSYFGERLDPDILKGIHKSHDVEALTLRLLALRAATDEIIARLRSSAERAAS